MTTPLVFTFVGADRPGLVQELSRTVADHGGNWLESRMSALAGQFAGIVQVEVPLANAPALRAALVALSAHNLSVVVAQSQEPHPTGDAQPLRLAIVGNDRPGIVREVSQSLAARHISVREMDTRITSAAMSGDPLFEASATIEVPRTLDLDELRNQLDSIADALTVHIDLDVLPATNN
jgi:glycine cleavage system regulatory protein